MVIDTDGANATRYLTVFSEERPSLLVALTVNSCSPTVVVSMSLPLATVPEQPSLPGFRPGPLSPSLHEYEAGTT